MSVVSCEDYIRGQNFVAECITKARESACCAYPGCGAKPIRSHVQQLRGVLRRIAEDDKVIAFDGMDKLLTFARRMYEVNGVVFPSVGPVETRRATSYPGFCRNHDTSVFKAIEHGAHFIPGDDEQLVAFFRRPYFYMRYCVEQSVLVAQELCALDVRWSSIRNMLMPRYLALSDYSKSVWSEGFRADLNYIWRVIKKEIPISCTCCIDLPVGLSVGRESSCLAFAAYALLPGDGETHAILIWDKKFATEVDCLLQRFSTKSNSALCEVLNELTFARSADFCVKPSFWKGVPENEKAIVEYNLMCIVARRLGKVKTPHIIDIPDGVLCVDGLIREKA